MKRVTDIIWWSVVSFVLILASVIILVKLLLPYADQYRQQIEKNVSQISGYDIRIDNISAKLEGLDPSFTISGVSLSTNKEAQPLRFERLMIRFNLWESFNKREPVFSYIRFYQTKVSLSESGGRWSLTGLPIAASENTGGFARIFNYLLDQRQISLVDTDIEIDSERIGRFDLSSNAVYLQRTQTGIGISANIHHQDYDDEFTLKAEIKGDLREPDSLSLEAEFDLPQVSITPSELTELESLKLAQLDVATKLWLSYSIGADVSLVGNVNLIPTFKSGDTLSLSAGLNSQYSLQSRKLSMQLSNLSIVRAGITYPPTNLILDSDIAKQTVDLRFDQLDLALGAELALPYMKQSWFVTGMLQAMQAQGGASNGHLKILKSPALSIAYKGNISIESSKGYRNIPSVSSLDALLTIEDNQGAITFASNDANIAFPLMYKDAWQVDGIAGRVEWASLQDAFLVTANDMYLNRNGTDLEADFRLEIVKDFVDTLALDIHAENLQVKEGLAYIPHSALPQSAHDWLNGALLEGRAERVDFVLQTELVEGARPQFLVDLDVDSAKVKFAPDWPVAKQIDANVLVDNAGVDLDLNFAKLDGVEGRDLSIKLPFTAGGLGELRLQGKVSDDLADVMALLSQTNLSQSVLKPFQSWHVQGAADASFELILPLSEQDAAEPYFNLMLAVSDTDLKIDDLNLSGTLVSGVLNYDTEKGIYNSNFDIKAFSGRAKLDLFGNVLASGALAISANVVGDLDLQDVMVWQKLPDLLTDATQGKVAFNADFAIDAERSGVIKIIANTDLFGASLALPKPFSKTANIKKPLFLTIDLSPEGVDVTLKYDQKYRSKLRFSELGFYGGQALINEPEGVSFVISPGLSLQGQLVHVELAAWRKLFSSPEESGAPQPLRLAVPEWLSYVSLIADQIRLNEDNLLNNAKLEYDRAKAVSDIYLTAEEVAVKLSKDLHGPVVNFSYLSWHSSEPKVEPEGDLESLEEVSAQITTSSLIRAQQIPSMTLNINELVINDKPYGDWGLLLTNLGKRLRIDPISTELEKGEFTGSLFWQDDEHSNVELILDIEGENIDELTQKFSPEALLSSKDYNIDVSLSWLGTPFDIQRETLTGRIDFTAENGVIEKINELPSFLKALGVFNIHALARRLTLEFSDVSSEGLTYDKVSTSLSIKEGLLTTLEPLRVISPAVEIELKGQADLVTETLDEHLLASFPLGNALPIAGLLLGVPQVAGILYITDKIFGSQLAKVTSVEYTIEGPFSDPVITPIVHKPKSNSKNRDK